MLQGPSTSRFDCAKESSVTRCTVPWLLSSVSSAGSESWNASWCSWRMLKQLVSRAGMMCEMCGLHAPTMESSLLFSWLIYTRLLYWKARGSFLHKSALAAGRNKSHSLFLFQPFRKSSCVIMSPYLMSKVYLDFHSFRSALAEYSMWLCTDRHN